MLHYQKNMLDFNYKVKLNHYTEKYNNNIVSDIDNIERLEESDEYLKPSLIKNNTTDYKYDLDKMYEDMDKVNFIKSGNSVTYINHIGCNIKISECRLLQGNQYNF